MNIKRIFSFFITLPTQCTILFSFFTIYYHICYLYNITFITFYTFIPILSILSYFIFYFIEKKYTILDKNFSNNTYGYKKNKKCLPKEKPSSIVVISIAFAIMLLYYISKNYTFTWLCCVLFLIYCIYSKPKIKNIEPYQITITSNDIFIFFFLSLLYLLLAFIVKRTDADDALFVAMAAHLLNVPQEALFQTDPLFHNEIFKVWPYQFEAFNVLSATIAQGTGIQPAKVSHYILAPIAAALFPLAWGRFLFYFGLTPCKFFFPFLILSFVLAESHASFGNFTFVRLFQGKGLFISVIVPLLYVAIWEYIETKQWINITKIFLISIAAFGCTASSIFIVPQLIVLTLGSAYRRIQIRTMFLAALPVGCYYIILASILFFTGTTTLQQIQYVDIPTEHGINYAFGETQKFILLFFILTSWSYIQNIQKKNTLLILTLGYILFPLNPYLILILNKIIPYEILWREMWVIPVWGIACIGLYGGVVTLSKKLSQYITFIQQQYIQYVLLCLFIILMLPFTNLRSSNFERLGLDTLWYPTYYKNILSKIEEVLSEGQSIAAPYEISCWLTTFKKNYNVYSHRYTAYTDRYLTPQNKNYNFYRPDLPVLFKKETFSKEEKYSFLTWLKESSPDAIIIKDSLDIQDILLEYSYLPILTEDLETLYIKKRQ